MRHRLNAPRRRAVAAVVAVLAAAMFFAATPAFADSTTTISGDVRLGSTPLVGYPVGYFSPTQGVLVRATTASDGSFTLQAPAGVTGFVYAGASPASQNAVSSFHGRSFVRAVIGRVMPAGTPGVLFQSLTPATPDQIAGGGAVHFRVQHSGRLTTTFTQAGAAQFFKRPTRYEGQVSVKRADGSPIESGLLRSGNTFTTSPLVPGSYTLSFTPANPALLGVTMANVRVVADRTSRVKVPHFGTGGTISGHVVAAGTAKAGVHVILSRAGNEVDYADTTKSGAYSFIGLRAGHYSLSFGRTGHDQDYEPYGGPQTTSENVLARTVSVTVPSSHRAVSVSPKLTLAAHVTSPKSTSYTTFVENANGTIQRYYSFTKSVGGLTAGSHTIIRSDGHSYDVDTVTVTTGHTTVLPAFTAQHPLITASATVPGVTNASVELYANSGSYNLFESNGVAAASGSVSVSNLVPGRYQSGVSVDGRAVQQSVVAITAANPPLTLDAGPVTGGYVGHFTANAGNPVAHLAVDAVDLAGDDIEIGPTDQTGASPGAGSSAITAPPGIFHYQKQDITDTGFGDNAPAADGPWWYVVPATSFTIASGETTTDNVQVTIAH